MSDIIQLLPDSVANQIAAGEVVQRPASVVKELMENSIDAGSTKIQLHIKDAGKTLIQVIDNGSGMSETDARMSFERHATSKIKSAKDLFEIRSKGFRGEALASIAAIAHVELKTKQEKDELGVCIQIEGSEVKKQEAVATADGTMFSVKNLFFNVPARRNFLKSDGVELRHIIEEFERVAMAHPEIEFVMTNNGNEVHVLPAGTLKKRIIGLMGKKYEQRLVPIEQETTLVNIFGFVCKPEFAKKTRGEQYLFVNNRFIKSNFLNHAIHRSYENLIDPKEHVSYFLFLGVSPDKIDINIHPTKTEIKFQDEKSIYAMINSTVKRSLGKFNVSPSLDFDQETSFNAPPLPKGASVMPPSISVNPDFNPFQHTDSTKKGQGGGHAPTPKKEKVTENQWKSFYAISEHREEEDDFPKRQETVVSSSMDEQREGSGQENKTYFQLHGKYIVNQVKSGLCVIDQRKAHQRILYEKFIQMMANNAAPSQQQLFPVNVKLNSSDFELLKSFQKDLKAVGFDLEILGKNTFVVNGLPADTKNTNPEELLELLVEQLKHDVDKLKMSNHHKIALSLSKSLCIKPFKVLSQPEMESLMNELFACENPYYSPNGKPTIITMPLEEINKKFE